MAEQLQAALALIRRKQVEARTGLSRSTIYLRIARGEFPKAISIGERSFAWDAREVAAWIEARIAKSRKVAP